MVEIKAYRLDKEYLGEKRYDDPNHPPDLQTRIMYVLAEKRPAMGKTIKARICIDTASSEVIKFDEKIKIPRKGILNFFDNTYVKEIGYDEFLRIFKIVGGIVEETRLESSEQTKPC